MRCLRLLVGVGVLAGTGCSFDSSGAAGLVPDASGADAGEVPVIDAGASADAGCAAELVDLCTQPPPLAPVVIAGADTLDTDSDPRCRTYEQAGGPDACLFYVEGLTISAGASLTATGKRPLLLAADGDVEILGLLDVASRHAGARGAGADFADCPAPAAKADDDLGGAGGGAGGSFAGLGGAGGTGDNDNSLGSDGTGAGGLPAPVQATPAFVRGGCSGAAGGDEGSGGPGGGGKGGKGGSSGGGVLVFSRTHVHVGAAGAIRATGAGADGGEVQAGGGGGGAGGFIGLEAPTVLVEGKLSANGGGGGGGGARVGMNPISGGDGADGDLGLTAAAGGTPAFDASGGQGGAGELTATPGGSSPVGGGGGGGGVGMILVHGAFQLHGEASPDPRTM